MPVAITCQSISKTYSARPLFKDISFTLDDRDKIGLIGPNGAGKSTLLKIMAGVVEPDSGTVVCKKHLHVAYLAQDNQYKPNLSLRKIVASSFDGLSIDPTELNTKVEVVLSRVGFVDPDSSVAALSGGWRKRLALAAELVKEPDFLLLDEPTNHLDLEGVLWLEEFLQSANFPFVVVSHDRSFIENVTNRTIELNPVYKDGFLSVKGPYSEFLQAYEEYMVAQKNEQQNLASKVRREIAWLQRGARARQTKSSARIREAGKLIDDLQEVKSRNAQITSAGIDFNASGRKTKELLVGKALEKSMGDKLLFSNLDIILRPKERLGLLGTNGSGKTTLLRILAGQIDPDQGTIKRAENLKIVWFDQNREQLDQKISLREALCPNGDSVIYQGRSIHVASWARRFLFKPDQLNLPVSYLSGGEQARIFIARLMLEPADILILDEPTNDLDIPTLEVLEDSLEEFSGAVVLVTHDRFMLDTISTYLLALNGSGGVKYFADYAQWEKNKDFDSIEDPKRSPAKQNLVTKETKKALSTAEKKELLQIGDTIERAEQLVAQLKKSMEHHEIASDHVKLQGSFNKLHDAEAEVSRLYSRWTELESRQEQ